ncbi:hypothetical protein [Erythrobacter sp. JK5]|uniref:hypothetical protein n=1 Tax=Erythrobacter sp. JK5 TaxID=2829500 RepID=UPI001BA4B146|nr:hypothetical protein [Erythrobacter sp. JK5]QUL37316.1 hypothetical protein KDC96_13240 [Erythrobacter sp. JK5]
MTIPLSRLPISLFAPCLIALAMTACSSGGGGAAVPEPEASDPPGAALPLSIGGQAAAEGEGTFEIAVNCAAALDLTAERLAQMSANPQSREIALLGRAEDHFETRAQAAQAADPDIIVSPAAAIARRRTEKAESTTEQAQLAIACLRRFGDDVGATTGVQAAS